MTRPTMVSHTLDSDTAFYGPSTYIQAIHEEPQPEMLRLYNIPEVGSATVTGADGDNVMTIGGLGLTGGICVDSNNNIYFLCSEGIRRIDWVTGIITLASSFTLYTDGQLGYDPHTNRVWYRDSQHNLDPDNTHLRMRVYDVASTGVSTVDIIVPAVGGTTKVGFGGVCFAPDGTMFIAACPDGARSILSTQDVYIVAPGSTTGVVYAGSDHITDGGHPLGDGGLATAATFTGINSLALDPAGNLYIADLAAFRIRKVDATTKIITTFYQNLAPHQYGDVAYLPGVGMITIDTNLGNSVIVEIPSGTFYAATNALSGGSNLNRTPAVNCLLNTDKRICVNGLGHVLTADPPAGAGNIFCISLIADQTHLPAWIAP